MIDPDHLDTILAALVERRNRLTHLDMSGDIQVPARPSLRSRIREVDQAIRAIKEQKRLVP